jgi:O-antigen/teichoic acid export membrane protein
MLRQSSVLFLAKIIGYGIRIILPAFLVRILTKAEIGTYNQFFLVEVLIATIFQLGINQSQYFFIPRDEKNAGGYFLNCVLLNIVIFSMAYGVIGVFRDELAAWLGMPVIKIFYWQLATYSILMLLNVSTQIYMTALKKYTQAAVFEISRQVLASVATLGAAYLTRSLKTIVIALIVARLVSLVLVLLYVQFRQRGFGSERYFFEIRKQVRYGIVLGAAGTIGTILMRMNETMVTKFYDIETYAVYAQGMKQIPILMFFTQSVAVVALVRFASLTKDNDWEGVRDFWNEVLGNMYAVGIPITILFIVIARPLISFMYTDAYLGAVPIFQLNAIAMLQHLVNPTFVLRAMDRNDITLKVNLAVIVILPVALYLGMKTFGLVGIVGVHAIVLVANRLVLHIYLNRHVPVHLPYIAPWPSIWAFYTKSFRKGRSILRKLNP